MDQAQTDLFNFKHSERVITEEDHYYRQQEDNSIGRQIYVKFPINKGLEHKGDIEVTGHAVLDKSVVTANIASIRYSIKGGFESILVTEFVRMIGIDKICNIEGPLFSHMGYLFNTSDPYKVIFNI